ncbi:hypothetical protein [Oleiphilus sp. HI0125]|uniref:hypothetical protein n=1 Tax=Oleiphilus sp. HI0125 TaxID=1822266 RepID=UPI0012E8CAE6|nr:hypothetical protein [Oleiphilus sp. HI0125]
MSANLSLPVINTSNLPDGWLTEQSSTAQRLFELAIDNLNSELSIADQRLDQLKQQAKGLHRERLAKVSQLAFMEEEIQSWKGMVEKKLANKLRIFIDTE